MRERYKVKRERARHWCVYDLVGDRIACRRTHAAAIAAVYVDIAHLNAE